MDSFKQAKQYFLQGLQMQALQKLDEAEDCFLKSLEFLPGRPSTLANLAGVQFRLGKLEEAAQHAKMAAAGDPSLAETHLLLGAIHAEQGDLAGALVDYDRALALRPDLAEAHNNAGIALLRLEREQEAIARFGAAIAINPRHAAAYHNRGNALAQAGEHEAALNDFEQAIAFEPKYFEPYLGKIRALRALDRFEDAAAACEAASSVDPTALESRRLGSLLMLETGKAVASLDVVEQVLAQNPAELDFLNIKGNALLALRNPKEAVSVADVLIKSDPNKAEFHALRARALMDGRMAEAAIQSYERAVALQPENGVYRARLAEAFAFLKRWEQAIALNKAALTNGRDNSFIHGALAFQKTLIADWDDLYTIVGGLVSGIENGDKTSTPFEASVFSDDPQFLQQSARIFALPLLRLLPSPVAVKRTASKKLNIAYLSPDFGEHPVSYLMADLLETHSRNQFVVHALGWGSHQSEMRSRIQKGVDHFLDIESWSDEKVVAYCRDEEIDIAVDLAGFTKNCRTECFARRLAPVQASYLGFLGTMGAPFMDYLFADPVIVPPEQREHYAEKIVSLPCYQVNDRQRPIGERKFTREELGLPRRGFVYCCFNATFKLLPDTFAIWMRILKAVPESVLLLYSDTPLFEANIKAAANSRQVDPDRIIFAGKLPRADYIARFRAADLFLDTFPYNAGTTASDALWAGIPVLTRMGRSFQSRVAASVLRAAGFPELAVDSVEAYEKLAIELGHDPSRVNAIKRTLQASRNLSVLFDTKATTRAIEEAYRKMVERHRAGLPPDHITIE